MFSSGVVASGPPPRVKPPRFCGAAKAWAQLRCAQRLLVGGFAVQGGSGCWVTWVIAGCALYSRGASGIVFLVKASNVRGEVVFDSLLAERNETAILSFLQVLGQGEKIRFLPSGLDPGSAQEGVPEPLGKPPFRSGQRYKCQRTRQVYSHAIFHPTGFVDLLDPRCIPPVHSAGSRGCILSLGDPCISLSRQAIRQATLVRHLAPKCKSVGFESEHSYTRRRIFSWARRAAMKHPTSNHLGPGIIQAPASTRATGENHCEAIWCLGPLAAGVYGDEGRKCRCFMLGEVDDAALVPSSDPMVWETLAAACHCDVHVQKTPTWQGGPRHSSLTDTERTKH